MLCDEQLTDDEISFYDAICFGSDDEAVAAMRAAGWSEDQIANQMRSRAQ